MKEASSHMVKIVKEFDKSANGQHDVHEFLIFVLDSINEEGFKIEFNEKQRNDPLDYLDQSNNAISKFSTKTSLFSDLFQGIFKDEIIDNSKIKY